MSRAHPTRLACVHVPALPLQLLMRRMPHWRGHPIAVVDEDRPQGTVLWVDERCRRARILPGMRFAAALALHADLCAGVVNDAEVTAALDTMLTTLRRFTPGIEPCAEQPGVWWLDASGLDALFPSPHARAASLAQALEQDGWQGGAVTVGFDRFDTYALAQARRGVCVLHGRDEERAAADRVALSRLHLPAKLRDTLARLGITDVAGLRKLPNHGVALRFGQPAQTAHEAATGAANTPFVAAAWLPPLERHFDFEPGSHDIDGARLLAQIEAELPALCALAAQRGTAIDTLHVAITGEVTRADRRDAHPPSATERRLTELRVRPATPTLAREQLIELLRLRLGTVTLGREIEGFTLRIETAPAAAEQLQLFAQGGCTGQRHREHGAALRALARLRAEFGDDAVVTAVRHRGHLPEAQFRWQPCRELRDAAPKPAVQPRLVRRLLTQPRPLAHQRAGEDGWFIGRLNFGPVQNLHGPYVLAGGWWQRPVHREYYFAQTRRGDVLWIFHDKLRRRWCAHGGIQ